MCGLIRLVLLVARMEGWYGGFRRVGSEVDGGEELGSNPKPK